MAVRVPDENFAREVMQLFTIGTVLLDDKGAPQARTAATPIESYTQDDVTNLARVFTGWDWQPGLGRRGALTACR